MELTQFISDNRIECILYDGDSNSRKPAILKIKVEKPIAINEEINLIIAPFENPSV
jgi:hypothetical protein